MNQITTVTELDSPKVDKKLHQDNASTVSKLRAPRLYNLDYLRGLAAFGIMLYHILSWSHGAFSADTFMMRIGIYGVSIFYVLSGLTLFHVYYNRMQPQISDLIKYFSKRIFRIYPLLILATLATIATILETPPHPAKILMNLTGLFGFVNWNGTIATGVWSIGNELVFYVFFPVFVYLAKFNRWAFSLLAILIFLIYLYFAFIVIAPSLSLGQQWRNYVNPLNQVFLFLGGFLIGLLFTEEKWSNIKTLIILVTGLTLLVFIPASGDRVTLVTGTNRLSFTLACLLICASFFKLRLKLPRLVHIPLITLGEASYSVYLLHPIIWYFTGVALDYTSAHFFIVPPTIKIPLAILSTLIISQLVYVYFEKYFMRVGQRISSFAIPSKMNH